jgi:serine/threonine protein kinase
VKTKTSSHWHFPFDRKNSRYSEKDAAVVVRQMLKVAAECHLRGLVHRDMKPEVKIDRF